MVPEPHLLLLLVLFGGWAGVDSISAGQFMVSRPVVAATVAGWIAGDPAAGALVGLVLEALNLTVLPVGAARYPDMGPAAVAAGALVAGSGPGVAALLTAVLFALGWSWVAASTVRLTRQLNIRLMSASLDGRSARLLERRHLAAIGVDYLRSCLLTAVGLAMLAAALSLTAQQWALPVSAGEVILWSVVAAGIAASLRLFGERRVGFFAVGAACGLLLSVLF
jgi:mannose/fructose/N-acetylgalactosamine-specific phosphotransferase system component IIC